MRGADGGRWRRICAVPAFWTGLLYDRTALDAAWDLVRTWSAEERQSLRDAVPRTGLRTPFRDGTVLDVAREAFAIARTGLARRGLRDARGNDETRFLEPVEAILREGISPAQEMLARYATVWDRSVAPLFTEYAF
jgi:glutamate--cysteine ligase